MQPTLSVLVPVYNAQCVLGQLIGQWIEILPDLTPHFELLIIDDGSTDATSEIAYELARDYPQIGLVRHPSRLGMAAAVRTGMTRTSGEMVLVRDEQSRADLYDLPKLWRFAGQHDIILGRVAHRSHVGWVPRLPGAPLPAEAMRPGMLLFHRRVARGWLTLGGMEELLAHLQRKGYPMLEVDVRVSSAEPDIAMLAEQIARRASTSNTPGQESRMPTRPAILEPKRPNYLARLKAFALGE